MPIVTLEDVREHLRLDEGEGDANLPLLIAAAAAHIEATYGIVSEARTESLLFRSLASPAPLPLRPVAPDSIVVTSLAEDGTETAMEGFRQFVLYGRAYVGVFDALASNTVWLKVTATIGFDDDTPATDRCRAATRAATLIMVAHLFRDREGAEPAPGTVDLLLDQFRLQRV